MGVLRDCLVLLSVIYAVQGGLFPDKITFIVNGTRAEGGQFPYMVSIRVGGSHNCGGAIINKRWILTAAHCASDEIDTEVLTVVAGVQTLLEEGEHYSVETKIPHSEWNSSANLNDIALIKVDRDIELDGKLVTTIPIARDHEEVPDGAEITIAGWGFTKYPSNEASNELLFAKLNSVNKEECQSLWGSKQDITDQHLCIKNDQQGTCLGDSGGPYTFDGRVVGVHILGDWCALQKPNVSTRVSVYLDWIKENMEANP